MCDEEMQIEEGKFLLPFFYVERFEGNSIAPIIRTFLISDVSEDVRIIEAKPTEYDIFDRFNKVVAVIFPEGN